MAVQRAASRGAGEAISNAVMPDVPLDNRRRRPEGARRSLSATIPGARPSSALERPCFRPAPIKSQ